MIKERKIEDLTSDIVCRELSFYIRYYKYYALPYDNHRTTYGNVLYNKDEKRFYIETTEDIATMRYKFTICEFVHWVKEDDRDAVGAIHFGFKASLPLDLMGLVLDFYRKEYDNNGKPKLKKEAISNE